MTPAALAFRKGSKGLVPDHRAYLDDLVARYKTPAFIAADPIRFPHQFRSDPRACELVAFLAALFSYGRRELILGTVANLLDRMDGDPMGFVTAYTPATGKRAFRNFVYRFNRPEDLMFLCTRLQQILDEAGSLEAYFLKHGLPPSEATTATTRSMIASFVNRFLNGQPAAARYGMKFLLANPDRGGACKRFNMFLRWMVRRDDVDGVDFGLWEQALTPDRLVMPLDTHVAQAGRRLGFIRRTANDWQTAEEITAVFRTYCPADPVKYDFALFGLGVSGDWKADSKSRKNIPPDDAGSKSRRTL